MKDAEKTKEQLERQLREVSRELAELRESRRLSPTAGRSGRGDFVEHEKMSALGRLTANVAHEIRNPVTVIGGLARRLRKSISPGSRESGYVELIMLEAERLEEILRDVLAFSKKTIFHREKCDINKVVDEVMKSFKKVFSERSISVQRSAANVPGIFIDRALIMEAVRSILSNAVDAMPDGGALTVTTATAEENGKNYVVLKISDTGAGIAEENLLMIFEPFFTTKVTKKETGLGLPIAKKIVEGHGGFIRVLSKVGKGAAFSLCFPYRAEE